MTSTNTASVVLIKRLFIDVRSLCIMVDGWTDKYKGKPFVAIRVSFIKHRQFRVVTLSCDTLTHHTGESVANAINTTVAKFCSTDSADTSTLKKIFIGLSHARPNSGISGDLLSENEAKPAVI